MQINHKKILPIHILAIILLSLLTSATLAYFSPGTFIRGFTAALIFSVPSYLILYFLWKWGGAGKTLAVMMFCSIFLRLGFGLATQNLLPIYGYRDEPQQQGGYLSNDVYRRDEETWLIAQNEKPGFIETIARDYNNDQYGGLAALSVWIYEYLSPDAKRFGLITLLGAFFTAAGIPFLYKAIQQKIPKDEKAYRNLANITAWIYVLYPDSIVFGGSALREPFLNGILAIAFWALVTLKDHRKKSAVALIICLLACLPLSTFVAGALLCCILLWIWGEFLIPSSKKWLIGGILFIAFSLIVVGLFALPSIQEFVHYDIHSSEINSGWVEKVVGEIGGQFRSVFLAIYGITQPVLPAILFYKPTTPYWKIVGIYRSLGWYIMVPFLFYAIFSAFRIKRKPEKYVFILNALFIIGWIFVSSLRAGGDQWDNPRYREIFLPWLAFFSAWGYCYARKIKDWWLVRWIVIELIFVGFFSQWYYSRYSHDAIRRFPFWKTVLYIVICSAIVFATGFVNPIRKRLKGKEK